MGIEKYDIGRRLDYFSRRLMKFMPIAEADKLAKARVADELSGIILKALLQACEEKGWTFALAPYSPMIMPVDNRWQLEGDPKMVAETAIFIYQRKPGFDWQSYFRGVIRHEEMHKEIHQELPEELRIPFARFGTREQYIGSWVEDYWINPKVSAIEPGHRMFEEVLREETKKKIGEIKVYLERGEIIGAGMVIAIFTPNQIRQNFPNYPELAEARELLETITKVEDLRPVYDRLLQKLKAYS